MRIRLATGRRALFLAMFAAAVLAFLPMRLALGWAALDSQGFSAREVTGSVWSGRLVEARFGDVALGDLDASVSPLALLIGRARIALLGGAAHLDEVVRMVNDRSSSLRRSSTPMARCLPAPPSRRFPSVRSISTPSASASPMAPAKARRAASSPRWPAASWVSHCPAASAAPHGATPARCCCRCRAQGAVRASRCGCGPTVAIARR